MWRTSAWNATSRDEQTNRSLTPRHKTQPQERPDRGIGKTHLHTGRCPKHCQPWRCIAETRRVTSLAVLAGELIEGGHISQPPIASTSAYNITRPVRRLVPSTPSVSNTYSKNGRRALAYLRICDDAATPSHADQTTQNCKQRQEAPFPHAKKPKSFIRQCEGPKATHATSKHDEAR